MTSTTKPDTTTSTSADVLAAIDNGAEFAHLDPATLLIETNVRSEAHLSARFVQSIRDHGVLTPVLVVRTTEGLRVRAGQRRTLGAIEAQQATIPAWIITGDEDHVRRIEQQMVENEDRQGLTDTDRAAAYQQLALLGVPAAKIAKRLGTTKDAVTAGITVATSRTGLDALVNQELTLEEAALFAEFEDDDEATETLTRKASHGWDLRHAAQQIRDRRTEDAAVAALTATLTEQGITIVARPGLYMTTPMRALDALRAKGSTEPLTIETHATCPGHAAYIDTDNDVTPMFVCTDHRAHGHTKIAAECTDDDGQAVAKTPMSDADKAERRMVVANNKAWRSAEVVRREWLKSFAARKTSPKGGAEFIGRAVTTGTYHLAKAADDGHRLAATLLGTKTPTHRGTDHITGLLTKASTPRSQVITLTVAVAAIEQATDVHTWRNTDAISRAYFTALGDWGYPLSDVEQIAAGRTPTPEPDPANAAEPADVLAA
ncbi:ParB/RepB/Spo0J family partition protein [Cellulomonas hominis]|uniref:ParB/RepB/Spo0J family partition protein n=1 Tax=Cellulomonas hominis TaxID=156981 RepID=UPI001B983E5E|nr:ParB N-terminal domain-containing protein [Cellulomonas hominis]VTR78957.1 Chromosome-partitioning protein Spo0J [Cellulomonas hominis]